MLVVEDNGDMRGFIRQNLEPTFRVIEARDGREGLDQAIATIPDLVVSDVMMPEMDGYQLSSNLKDDERTAHIPVILLTAKASTEEKIEGLETGADDYLVKPFDSEELIARVQKPDHPPPQAARTLLPDRRSQGERSGGHVGRREVSDEGARRCRGAPRGRRLWSGAPRP